MNDLQLVILPVVAVLTVIVVGGIIWALNDAYERVGWRMVRRTAERTTVVDPMDPRVQAQIDEIRPLGVWLDAREAEELVDVVIDMKRRLDSIHSSPQDLRIGPRARDVIMRFNAKVKETR